MRALIFSQDSGEQNRRKYDENYKEENSDDESKEE